MGWAGPAQPTGPNSAQNCWADLGPKKNIIFWARPGPEYRARPDSAQKAGLGQDPPGPDQNGRGELISPHPCMQNAIRSACREGKTNKNQNRGGRRVTWRGGGGGAGVATAAGGGAGTGAAGGGGG